MHNKWQVELPNLHITLLPQQLQKLLKSFCLLFVVHSKERQRLSQVCRHKMQSFLETYWVLHPSMSSDNSTSLVSQVQNLQRPNSSKLHTQEPVFSSAQLFSNTACNKDRRIYHLSNQEAPPLERKLTPKRTQTVKTNKCTGR